MPISECLFIRPTWIAYTLYNFVTEKFNSGGVSSGMDAKYKIVWEGSLQQEEG